MDQPELEVDTKPPEGPAAPIDVRSPAAPAEKPVAVPTNGTHHIEEDDDLTPPPENIQSPVEETDEQLAGDEIIVGANRNGVDRPSPLRVVSDHEDDTIPDGDDDQAYAPPQSSYPKRKRNSLFHNDLRDEEDEDDESSSALTTSVTRTKPIRRNGPAFKHAVLGYWRDSEVPDEAGKHSVIGFIDVRDRLRTRIQTVDRAQRPVNNIAYPVPPGPGGSWVTFERVVFEPHLLGLNHHHVKEFVKQRAGAEGESPQEKEKADQAAVEEAKRRLIANPPSETAPQPAVAYGSVIPEDAIICSRSEIAKRRKLTSSGVATIGGGRPSTMPKRQHSQPHLQAQVRPHSSSQPLPELEHSHIAKPVPIFEHLACSRPTRIVIGYWKGSDAPGEANKHAVLGILGNNDTFRAKISQETRSGKLCKGTFPQGAGALWVQWAEVELEPQLKSLSRTEIKEYCRVRQYQLDQWGPEKTEEDQTNSENYAVYVAQQRVMHGIKTTQPHSSGVPARDSLASEELDYNAPAYPRADIKPATGSQELRSNLARTELPSGRHSLPNLDSRQSSRTPVTARRDITNHAQYELERFGAQEARRAHYSARLDAVAPAVGPSSAAPSSRHMAPAGSPYASAPMTNNGGDRSGRTSLPSNAFHDRDQVRTLDSIWALQEQTQEQQRSRAGDDSVKFHGGIKYERKSGNLFRGSLVSQGNLISIDGEDYVEYRVLAKIQL